ncbi:MAG: diacylglycerol kinase family lipid kinase [Bacteroidota bacterium]|nr:diacylglycerol kinase family lipid kinase [Bacteroidota bacterium]
MTPPLKIVFIINPASGSRRTKPNEVLFRKHYEASSEIIFLESKNKGHASDLAAGAVSGKADAVIAVGGDGTVNEIAKILNGTSCALGIIPCGSGNGLARHHKISLNIPDAISVVKRFKIIEHDAILINGQLCFNVSGVGFDAHVAHLFGKDGKRGFNTYAKLVMKEFSAYRETVIKVKSSQETIEQPIMLAAIANASQFGNNARIAPFADTNDGIADITLVRKMNAWLLPSFAFSVFTKHVANSPYAKLIRAEKFTIACEKPLPLHLDGEPAGFSNNFEIQTLKGSLKIIVP